MNDKIIYWISVVFAGLAILLLVCNMALISGNRSIQEELNKRQMSIDTAARLTPLNQSLADALAEASVKNNDKDIRELLSSQGITIKAEKEAGADKNNSKKK